jgi:trk system potassium uptake protein
MNIEVGILGLGRFGFTLGDALVQLGHKVIGVDADHERVKRAQDILTRVYRGDATDKEVLAQLGIHQLQAVVVSVGHSMESSILIALHLLELGTPRVVVKALSRDHEKVLRLIGVHESIFPERFAAEQLARRLHVPGLIEYLPMGQGIILREFEVSGWAGMTLADLELPARFGVQVVAIRKKGEEQLNFVPRAMQTLQKGDVLVVIGREQDIQRLES